LPFPFLTCQNEISPLKGDSQCNFLKGVAVMEENSQTKATSVREALAVCARELAEMLNVSLRQVWRLNSAGKLPRPIRLGGSVRWDRQEILDWFKAGCPARQAWEARRAVQG
jgi:predicted DNA-binding transcriptional regulator AlpA